MQERFFSPNRRAEVAKKGVAALAAGALLLPGACSLNTYETDTSAVQCDGKRTIAEFSDFTDRVSFNAHQKGAQPLTVIVARKLYQSYTYDVVPTRNDPTAIHVIGSPVANGSANPDYSISHGNALWNIDVQPGESIGAAIISGNCS